MRHLPLQQGEAEIRKIQSDSFKKLLNRDIQNITDFLNVLCVRHRRAVFIVCNGGTVNVQRLGDLILCKFFLFPCCFEILRKAHYKNPRKTKNARHKAVQKNTQLIAAKQVFRASKTCRKSSVCFYRKNTHTFYIALLLTCLAL